MAIRKLWRFKTMLCPNCGSFISLGDAYCPSCGATFESDDEDDDDYTYE